MADPERSRSRSNSVTLLLIFVLAATGCDSGRRLWIDVRTNLTPGRDVYYVEVDAEGLGRTTMPMRTDANWGRGERVATYDQVGDATVLVTVRLRDKLNRLVVERPALVVVRGDTAVTIVLTRDCRGVTCESTDGRLQACFAGACVDAACVDGSEPECPPARCGSSAECPTPPAIECATSECVAGACVDLPLACEADLVCDVEAGCVAVEEPEPLPDAGTPPDASTATDAGGADASEPDAGSDAGTTFECTPRGPRLVFGPSIGNGRLPVQAHEGRYWLAVTESATDSRIVELDSEGDLVRDAPVARASAVDLAFRDDEVALLTHEGSTASLHRFLASSLTSRGTPTSWAPVNVPSLNGLVSTASGFEYVFDVSGIYMLLHADPAGVEQARFPIASGQTWYRMRASPLGSLVSARNGSCWAAVVEPDGTVGPQRTYPSSARCFDNDAALNGSNLAAVWHESSGGRRVYVTFFDPDTGAQTRPRTLVSPNSGQHAPAVVVEEGLGFRVAWVDSSLPTHAVGLRHVRADGTLGALSSLPLEPDQQIAPAALRVLRNRGDTALFWRVDGAGTYFATVCE